jgi:uncharacterized protein
MGVSRRPAATRARRHHLERLRGELRGDPEQNLPHHMPDATPQSRERQSVSLRGACTTIKGPASAVFPGSEHRAGGRKHRAELMVKTISAQHDHRSLYESGKRASGKQSGQRLHITMPLPPRLTWAQRSLIRLLRGYQRCLSARLARTCIYEPSCSDYAVPTIAYNGALVDAYDALRRWVRCRPQLKRRCWTIQGDVVYNIESTGRVFTTKTREQLETRLNAEARDGWYFHSVFSVTETSCFGFQKVNTYDMVLTRVRSPHAASNSVT